MKKCPQCGREYDITMMFCLDDGAELLYGPAPSEPPASAGGQFGDKPQTAILHSTAAPDEAPSARRFTRPLRLPFFVRSGRGASKFFRWIDQRRRPDQRI